MSRLETNLLESVNSELIGGNPGQQFRSGRLGACEAELADCNVCPYLHTFVKEEGNQQDNRCDCKWQDERDPGSCVFGETLLHVRPLGVGSRMLIPEWAAPSGLR